MNKKSKVEVVQDQENKIPISVLAKSIKEMSDGFKKMKGAGLTERTMVVLLNDASGVSKVEIRKILWAMDQLEKLYLDRKAK